MTLFMVELPVSDFERSLTWYRDQLQLKVDLIDTAKGFALLSVPGGGRLAIKASNNVLPSAKVHFEVSDLQGMLQELAKRHVRPESEVKTSTEGYCRALLRDPDGHVLVLFQWTK